MQLTMLNIINVNEKSRQGKSALWVSSLHCRRFDTGGEMDDALKLEREFEHVMCRFRRMDYSVLHPGVGNMEFAVLEMIHKLSAQHDAIYGAAISDLQKKMEILPSALSRLLRGMEEKGLCVRSIDPKDRRSSYVSLTETGQERRDQGHCIMEVFAQRVVERMGEGRFRELIKQWERFGDVLETEIAAFRNVDGMEE